eukprot:gene6915-14045_t
MALVEIVHFHKLLRGEMENLVCSCSNLKETMDAPRPLIESDIELFHSTKNQFFLFLSVFKAHASAEDNTIWPALREKHNDQFDQVHEVLEDHTEEEARFQGIANNLKLLEECLHDCKGRASAASSLLSKMEAAYKSFKQHLDREEAIVHPLIQDCMSNEEIEKLVGQIMGYRSSEMMEIILKMMVRNLNKEDKDFMFGSMQKAVKDTYFEKWLSFLEEDFSNLEARRLASSLTSTSTSHQQDQKENEIKTIICHSTSENNNMSIDITENDMPQEEAAKRRQTLLAAMELIATCNGLSSTEKTKVMAALHNDNKSENLKRDREIELSRDNLNIHSDTSTDDKDEHSLPNKICKHNSNKDDQQQHSHHSSSALLLASKPHPHIHSHSTDNQGTTIPGNESSGHSIDQDHTYSIPLIPAEDREATYRPGTGLGPGSNANNNQSPNPSLSLSLGCSHYKRGCKLVAPCCNRAFTCRLCHDDHYQNDHTLDRELANSAEKRTAAKYSA